MRIPKTCFSTPLSKSAREIERRIRNIFHGMRGRPPVWLMALAVAVILSCGGLVSCQIEKRQSTAAFPVPSPELFPSPSPAPSDTPMEDSIFDPDNTPYGRRLRYLESLTASDSQDMEAVYAIAQAWLDWEISLTDGTKIDSRIDFLELAWESDEFAAYRFEFYFLASNPESIVPTYDSTPILIDGGWYRPKSETPYLLLCDGTFYSVVYSNTFLLPAARIPLGLDANLPPRPTMFVSDSPTEALRAVLLGQAQFISVAKDTRYQPLSIYDASRMFFSEERTLTIRLWEARSHPYDFAVADLDRDGIPEVTLAIPDGGCVILHYEEGTVYGYETGHRWSPKPNGMIHFSGGAASYGYGFMTFMGDTVLIYKETYCYPRSADWSDMLYVVDREETSREEFEAACTQLDAMGNVVWCPSTAENVELALSDFT